MKALNKKATLSLVALTLMLTACNPPADAGDTPAPTATATVEATVEATPSATPSPTESATQSAEEIEAGYDQQVKDAEKAWVERPLGIDIEDVYANNMNDDVLAVFPEEQFGTKEGIASALRTYQHLNALTVWNTERDAKQDFQFVAPFAGVGEGTRELPFDKNLLDSINADIAANGAMNYIPTAPGGFQMGDTFHEFDNEQTHLHTFNHPGVAVTETGDGLVIGGTRSYNYALADGKRLTGKNGYSITIKPVEGGWIITNLGWSSVDGAGAKVTND